MDPSDFRITVNGRPFRVTVDRSFVATGDRWCPVDVTDTRTRMSAQAIIEESVTGNPWRLVKEDQFRDAVRSSYGNATNYETGTYGKLPDDFRIGYRGTVVATYLRTLNSTSGNPRRGWTVYVIDHNSTVMYLGFIDEEYSGNGAHSNLRQQYPEAVELGGWHEIKPSEYNRLMKGQSL